MSIRWSRLARAFLERGHDVVWAATEDLVVTVGPGRDPAALGEQPENVHVASYIAQTKLLSCCAAAARRPGVP